MRQLTAKLLMVQDKPGLRRVAQIAWPAMIESFFVAVTPLIDQFMLSGVGYYAIAAVGLTAQPKFIAIAPFLSVNVAINALVARRKGQEDRMDAHRILLAALLFACAGAVVIGALCASLSGPLMRLVGSGADTHDSASKYFRIIMGGIVFNVIYLTINAAQRGSGKTNLSMRTNVVSSLVNIFFNWLLIEGRLGCPAMGVTGAAIATVLGSVAACMMSILSLLSKDSFLSIGYFLSNHVRATAKTVGAITNIASSVLVENILIRLGYMATALMAAKLGSAAMAAHNVGLNLLTLSFSVGDGIQVAAVALIGQSLGQGTPERAKYYGRMCQELAFAAAAFVTIFYLLGGRRLYTLFFPEDPDIVVYGVMIIHRLVAVIAVQISQVVYLGALRGAGDTKYVSMALIVSVTIVRAGTGYLFCEMLGMGLPGLWLSILADQVSRYLFTSVRFKKGRWTDIVI